NKGFRYIETLVITLILIIGDCFLLEIIFARPNLVEVLGGFAPKFEIVKNPAMLYVAIDILSATVIPHNLYLHSSIIQTHKYEQNTKNKRETIKFATIDSTTTLIFTLFINAAILIVSSATFHNRNQHKVAEIQNAYHLLNPTLTMPIANVVFTLTLLTSDQN